jgi:hypothetical protein
MPLATTIRVKRRGLAHSMFGIERYYHLSQATIRRRIRDPAWAFPAPDFTFKGVRFWFETSLKRVDLHSPLVEADAIEPWDDVWPPPPQETIAADEAEVAIQAFDQRAG